MQDLEALKTKTGQLLEEGWKTGYLTEEEYTWRSGHLANASTVDGLEALVRDLMEPAPAPPAPMGSTSSIAAVLGSRRVSSESLFPAVSAVDVLGSLELDYTNFVFGARQSLSLVVIMGEAVVVLPRGVRVKNQVVPLLGDCQEGNPGTLAADAPVLDVSAVVIMGSLRYVYRGPT